MIKYANELSYFEVYVSVCVHSHKLHQYDTGTPRAWITSYLSGRFQTICVDGELSIPELMNHSVPQGSGFEKSEPRSMRTC